MKSAGSKRIEEVIKPSVKKNSRIFPVNAKENTGDYEPAITELFK